MTPPQYFQYPALSFQNQLQAPSMQSGSYGYPSINWGDVDLNKVETRSGTGTQSATNVLDVRNPLQALLNNYRNDAVNLGNQRVNLGRTRLGYNFAGPNAFQNQLNNGIDYFGRMGISEGIQNINLQRDAQNNQLSQSLSRTPGNETLLGILQNQNLFKSQLAANPLIGEAQKGTASRVEQQINLQNQLQNLMNQTKLQQGGFNQQAQLAELQSRLALQQPTQNLLEILSSLQGQQRGTQVGESQTLARNFK